jgi:hypothetical protein
MRYLALSPFLFNELSKRKVDRKEPLTDVVARLLGLLPKSKRRRFYLSSLQVGDSVLIPWDGARKKRHPAILRAIRNEEKRTGKEFERHGNEAGLLTRRVK